MRLAFAIAWAIPALAQYEGVYQRLEALAESERSQKNIPSIAIALVDDQRVVWQRVFGEGKAETIYRVGSVSKLFTDIAVMHLADQKRLDIDAPVTNYLPDFKPRTTAQRKITLRLLMSHRSGLVREPPRGHYFDVTSPSLTDTVLSLNDTDLVYDPGAHNKYSNAAIAVVGRVIERVTGKPFRQALQEIVLQPLGMKHSDFALRPDMRPLLSKAFLWTYDGRRFAAPQFELGMAPAGSLYTTLGDLGLFTSCLFRGGAPVLNNTTLARMWEPQLGGNFGLGFVIGKMAGMKTVSHGGAIYGFATDLTAIPTEKLAAIVVVNMDSANAVASQISQQALTWMRQARQGVALEEREVTRKLTPDEAAKLVGRYGEGDDTIELTAREDRLFLTPARGGHRAELRWAGDDLMTDGLLSHGLTFRPVDSGLQTGSEILKKQPASKPAAAPLDLRQYLGEYGWDHNVLYVLERAGKLTVLIEWYDYYSLTPVKPNEFRFPDWGLYDGELLTFTPEGARIGGVLFPKRTSPQGAVFRLTPVRPVPELLEKALSIVPPQEYGTFLSPDFVELRTLDKTIRLDIRYATKDNFLSTPVYSKPKAFLQRPAAEALVRAHRALESQGFGLMIHDAYRPWYVTRLFWDATPPDKHIFVADPEKGSRHNRGSAVDLTLFDRKTGKAVEMPGLYDEMTERSYPDYPGSTELARWHREVLRQAMEKEGFRVFDVEWWHFDFKGWEKYQIANFRWDQ
jgi:CubicO group peptidase (beta-lactamase class C family)/D-alanyl-D-alanine dipeptidase